MSGELLDRVEIDFSLLPTERLAFGKAALGRFDSPSATPAQPLPCAELLHPIQWVMCPAAIAK